jgi:hypothetical protein
MKNSLWGSIADFITEERTNERNSRPLEIKVRGEKWNIKKKAYWTYETPWNRPPYISRKFEEKEKKTKSLFKEIMAKTSQPKEEKGHPHRRIPITPSRMNQDILWLNCQKLFFFNWNQSGLVAYVYNLRRLMLWDHEFRPA